MKVKITGFALMGILAMMVIPYDVATDSAEHTFYGAATMVQKNADGEEMFSQTVHNQLLDVGELFLLNQTFNEASNLATTDDRQMGAICISMDSSGGLLVEGLTAATFDATDGTAETNCRQDETVTVDPALQTAVVGALTFECGSGLNCDVNDTIEHIGICQNLDSTDVDFATCAAGGSGSGGILFAAVKVTPTQLGASETVDITYTFDISSGSS